MGQSRAGHRRALASAPSSSGCPDSSWRGDRQGTPRAHVLPAPSRLRSVSTSRSRLEPQSPGLWSGSPGELSEEGGAGPGRGSWAGLWHLRCWPWRQSRLGAWPGTRAPGSPVDPEPPSLLGFTLSTTRGAQGSPSPPQGGCAKTTPNPRTQPDSRGQGMESGQGVRGVPLSLQ